MAERQNVPAADDGIDIARVDFQDIADSTGMFVVLLNLCLWTRRSLWAAPPLTIISSGGWLSLWESVRARCRGK